MTFKQELEKKFLEIIGENHTRKIKFLGYSIYSCYGEVYINENSVYEFRVEELEEIYNKLNNNISKLAIIKNEKFYN